jgi:hypothetical protein
MVFWNGLSGFLLCQSLADFRFLSPLHSAYQNTLQEGKEENKPSSH